MNHATAEREHDLSPAMILALAAEIRENAVKDKTYQESPIGRLVAAYLNELAFQNASPKTVINREATLAWLSLDYAHIQPLDLTYDRLREFVTRHWKDSADNTKAMHISGLRMFTRWAYEEGYIPEDVGRKLRPPKVGETRRRAHHKSVVRKLILAQPMRRDRIALQLLYWCALRRNELRLIQWQHIDLARNRITVFGKGRKVVEQAFPQRLGLEIERYVQDEGPKPDHFLLFPYKTGRRGQWPHYREDVVWEDRGSPYGESGMSVWWGRMCRNAGLDRFPMHEMRHTAGTHFQQAGHDLLATQHFMRHESAATTERVYLHLDKTEAVTRIYSLMDDPLDDDGES